MTKYSRNIIELRAKAAFWWPEELKNKNALGNFCERIYLVDESNRLFD